MIQATELRIGNWVRTTPNIEDVNDDDYKQAYVTSNHIREIDLKELLCLGIPLTEEWFIKFGFADKINYFVKDGEYRFTLGFQNVFVQVGPDDMGCFLRTIKYVHELQNLYFALTGDELTIS